MVSIDHWCKRPLLVMRFGGLPPQPEGKEGQIAEALIQQFTPEFSGEGFEYSYSWIFGLLLVRVRADRFGTGWLGSHAGADSRAEICLN